MQNKINAIDDRIKMASLAPLMIVLSVTFVVAGGISKRQDIRDDVCSGHSKGMSFLETERLLHLHKKA